MISSNVERKVTLVVGATDNASGTVAAIGRNVRNAMNEAGGVGGAGYGPARSGRFDDFESTVRDRMAGQVKAMRDAAGRARIDQEVKTRMFGEQTPTSSIDQRAFGIADRSAMEQSGRDRQAQQLRDERASRELGRYSGGGDLNRESREQFRATKSGSGAEEAERGAKEFSLRSYIAARSMLRLVEIVASIPKVMESYKESVRYGENQFTALGKAVADNTPFIGHFVQAGMAIGQIIRDLRDNGSKKAEDAEKDRQQEERETRQRLKEQRDEKASAVKAEAKESLLGSSRSLRSVGASDRDNARFSYEDQVKAAGALRAKAGTLSTTKEQDEVRKQADEIEANARLELRMKLNEIDHKYNAEEIETVRKHNADVAKINEDAAESELRRRGFGLAASLKQIQARHQEELEQAKHDHDEEFAKVPVGSAQAKYDAVNQRYQDKIAALKAKAAEEEAQIKQDNQREIEDGEREHQDRVTDVHEQAAEIQLRMQGKSRDAEQLGRDSAHRKSLEDIKTRADVEARAHGERLPAIQKRAKEEADAENQLYEMKNTDAREREQQRTRVGAAAGFTGESHLLQGVLGSTRDAHVDPTLEPALKTAANTANIHTAIQQQTQQLVVAIGHYQAPPVAQVKF